MVTHCPQCKSDKSIDGRIYNQPDYVAPRAYFRPNGLRAFALLGVNVRIENHFSTCFKCGFMWAKLDTEQLTRVLGESGTQQTRARLGLPQKS